MRWIIVLCLAALAAFYAYKQVGTPSAEESLVSSDGVLSTYIELCLTDDERSALSARARSNRRSNIEQLRKECPVCKCQGAGAISATPNIPDPGTLTGR
jgi:hypothetical protein